MVQLGDGVDVEKDSEEYRGEKEIIEPGWKAMALTGSELKDNSAKTGKLLVLTFQLMDGTGRTIVDRLNYVNPNETAQKISRQRLAHIAKVAGIKGTLTNTDPLHGRPVEGKVTIDEYEYEGKPCKSNKIGDYRIKQAGDIAGAKSTESKGW